MIPVVHTRHVCCVYDYIMHLLVWVFETLVVIWPAVFLYTKWPLDVRILGHRDAIVCDSVTWHTSLYDRARPRPRLRDRAGVCLCKCYDSIDNMVEETCL